jgi:hypothetical protein
VFSSAHLIHRLEPSRVIVRVGHHMHVDLPAAVQKEMPPIHTSMYQCCSSPEVASNFPGSSPSSISPEQLLHTRSQRVAQAQLREGSNLACESVEKNRECEAEKAQQRRRVSDSTFDHVSTIEPSCRASEIASSSAPVPLGNCGNEKQKVEGEGKNS